MQNTFPFLGKQSRRAFTLIELLVVISIIAVLAGISLPIISSVKESGNSAKCISNLRQIGAALNLYCGDNNNHYPPLTSSDGTRDWDTDAINPYLPERTAGANGRQSVIFICPSAKYTGSVTSDLSRTYTATDCLAAPSASNYSYKVANSPSGLNSLASSLLLFDGSQWSPYRYSKVNVSWPDVNASGDLLPNGTTKTYIDYRHHNAFHGLYADGHVDTINRSAASGTIKITNWRASNQ